MLGWKELRKLKAVYKTKCLTFIFHLPGTGIEVLLKIKKEDFVISKIYFRIPSFTDLFVRSTNY